jgi:hypothetical protein
MRGKFCSKAIKSNLVVVIETLQHSHDLLDCANIEILIVIRVMQWLWLFEGGISVVDAQDEMQSGSINDIGEKRISIDFLP